jgi:hypothetical protein
MLRLSATGSSRPSALTSGSHALQVQRSWSGTQHHNIVSFKAKRCPQTAFVR